MTALAVVPIFVNAGAAVLPAVVSGLATGLAMLLRPRELLRLCRRRPAVPAVALLAIAAVGLGGKWLLAATADGTGDSNGPTAADAAPYDWARVGREIVAQRALAVAASRPATRPAPGPGDTMPGDPAPSATAATIDLGLGRDASRCSADASAPPAKLVEAWSYAAGEPDTYFLSSPLVSAGVVYAASCQIDTAGKYGYVVALDARTGREIWKVDKAPDGTPFKAFFSSPALSADGRSLVVGQGLHDSADCALLCLDAATGKVRWQVPTPLHIESSPAIRGDLAVVGAGAIEDANHQPTGDPGFVLAVQISTGKELWRYRLADPESSPAIGPDGTIYIGSGFNGDAVVALRPEPDADLAAKGLKREIWRAAVGYPVTSAITLSGDLVVAGAGNSDYVNVAARPAGAVVALDRATGQVRWNRPTGDSVLGHVASADGKLVVPIRSGHVALLDAATGREAWRVRVNGGAAVLAGCAVAVAGSGGGGGAAAGRADVRAYAVTKDGWLAVLDARGDGTGGAAGTGRVLERVFVNQKGKPGENGFCLSSPTVADGRLYVGSETGGLRCFAGTR